MLSSSQKPTGSIMKGFGSVVCASFANPTLSHTIAVTAPVPDVLQGWSSPASWFSGAAEEGVTCCQGRCESRLTLRRGGSVL